MSIHCGGRLLVLNYFDCLSEPRTTGTHSTQIDYGFVIMRSPFKGLPTGWRHVPALAPSKELFGWSRAQITTLPKNDYSWWPRYKEGFIAGMTSLDLRPEDQMPGTKPNSPRGAIKRMTMLMQEGATIAICCSCLKEQYCHRSLVAEEMELLYGFVTVDNINS
jgi:hypothetical protein